jgi:alpha-galactosidase
VKTIFVLLGSIIFISSGCTKRSAANALFAQQQKPPIMGWSSWNHFRVNINEKMIREQADAMKSSGMYDAGYRFINIDDGYFGGRDSTGKLFADVKKFPSGMKALADYIHSKGLKAGIYTDAGQNTCGSMYDNDPKGLGVGIYGHIEQDCHRFFKEWGYNFLKVDWCGGEKMNLDEETEYTKIINAVKAVDSDIVFNVCRWKFPGVWAITKADSWRISGDIESSFSSILKIIDLNADLYQYSSGGHYNDMDMLQVGRGMSYDEDKAHFSMWCMLNSPLLAGNDLRHMSKETVEILTNKELIALNQDTGFVQARRIFTENNVEVWTKPLGNKSSKTSAIAILNRGGEEKVFKLTTKKVVGVPEKSRLRDLWLHKDLGKIGSEQIFSIPKHGIVVLKIDETYW